MGETENEEVAGGGAVAEHGGYGLQLLGRHAAGGAGVQGSVVEERVEDRLGQLGLGLRSGAAGCPGGGGGIPGGEESESESEDEEEYENHEPRAVGSACRRSAGGLVVEDNELSSRLHIV